MRAIILCGFMSSGKSTVGRALADRLNIEFLDTDEVLVKTYGMSIKEMFERYGEDYFRDREAEIARIVADKENVVISTGGGMLTFERNGEVLKDRGIIIVLNRDFEKIYMKLSGDNTRPMVKSKTKQEIRKLHDDRIEKYNKYAIYSVTNNESIDACVGKIVEILRENGELQA